MGTTADKDTEVFGGTYRDETLGPLDLVGCRVSENGHWLIVTVSHGVPATREDILLKDLRKPGAAFEPLVYGVDSRFELHMSGDRMFVSTDFNAPNGRVLRASFGDASTKSWPVVIPEGTSPIRAVSIVDGVMFVGRLADVKTETKIYSLHGKEIGEIKYPTIGSGSVVFGREKSDLGFYTFSSFTVPPTIYSYNVATGESLVWSRTKAPFDSSQYEVRQVFYKSKDGTRVPMFIAGRKGLAMDGSAPLLMTGYGGFDISETPAFDPKYVWWMEQGGFFALPNLRGGGEYGETWHKAGMFEHKQNVFDDWFAAAEYLIANKYTTRNRLAITGRSNGGLLMGASMTQRPDLYGAILCGYPLLDMSRYQRFLVGRWWTTEYGSAENPEQAAYILKYSPYQNIRQGVQYPAIMFLSGDSDTRVAPLHARKMAAAMQATVMAEPESERRPVLLHYDTRAGHSAGVSVQQAIHDTADELTFLWNETGGK
jgi:prolyl oligopeptidase